MISRPFDLVKVQRVLAHTIGSYHAIAVFGRESTPEGERTEDVCIPSDSDILGIVDPEGKKWFWEHFSRLPNAEGYVPRRDTVCTLYKGLPDLAGWATETHVFICNALTVTKAMKGAKMLADAYRDHQKELANS